MKETRRRYLVGVDKHGQPMAAMIKVDVGSPADKATPEKLGRRFELKNTREVAEEEYKAVLRRMFNH